MKRTVSLFGLSSFLLLAACGPQVPFDDGGVPQPVADSGTSPETGTLVFGDSGGDAKPAVPDAGSCDPPDMLVILDRSDSMSSYVGTQGTRISLAVNAIDLITQAPTDTTVRFGLQVLPGIGQAECSTQMVVPIGLGNGGSIAHSLATMSPQLDYGTPIGNALAAAQQTLAATKVNGRKQYVLLVTDGGECCSCGTTNNDIAVTQKLYAAGVETYVVGFGGDDDPVLLNNLACAGHTAKNFATDCTCTSAGCALNPSVSSSTTQDYYKSSDGTALKQALASITNETCCGCTVTPN